ncbi:MAG TPA: hypothetical protein PKA38_03500 [Candidatus Levybacteria bacterium]|nr:hypothetical protein [Candidatus Levybacteria bacterium]
MMKKHSPSNIDESGRAFFTKEELDEFKEIALKEHGAHLTDEQAFEQGFALFNLFDYLIKQTVTKKREFQSNSL